MSPLLVLVLLSCMLLVLVLLSSRLAAPGY